MMRIRLAASLLALVLCAFVNLAHAGQAAVLPAMDGLPVEIVFSQQEIEVDMDERTRNAGSGAGGVAGMLFGAIVANKQAKNSERRVAELRNLLIDYDFRSRMDAALKARLPSVGIAVGSSLRWVETLAQGDDFPKQALVLIPRYSFNHEFTAIHVSIIAGVQDREDRGNGKRRINESWARLYSYNIPLIEPSGEIDDDAALWAKFGKARLDEMLNRATDSAVELLVYDLGTEGRAEALSYQYKRREWVYVKEQEFDGHEVKVFPGEVWARYGKPGQQTLQAYAPIEKP